MAYINADHILSKATYFENLVKRAFTEAPPVLLEKLYNVYETMYLEYVEKLKEKYSEAAKKLPTRAKKKKKLFTDLEMEHENLEHRLSLKEDDAKERLPKHFLSNLRNWMNYIKVTSYGEDPESQFAYNYLEKELTKKFNHALKYGISYQENFWIPTQFKNPPYFLPRYLVSFGLLNTGNETDFSKEENCNKNIFKFNLKIMRPISAYSANMTVYESISNYLYSYNEIINIIEELRSYADFPIDYKRDTEEFLQYLRTNQTLTEEDYRILSKDLPELKGGHSIYRQRGAEGYQAAFPSKTPKSKILYDHYQLQKGDLKGWRWQNLIPPYLYSRLPSIKLILTIGPSHIDEVFKTEHFGSYSSFREILSIGIPKFTLEDLDLSDPDILNNKIKSDLSHIKSTLNHELGHYFQQFSSDVTFGLPPKIKEKSEYDISGLDPSGKRKQEHQFRAIEIYPRLGDSIMRFKEKIKWIPPDMQSKFIRNFIGLNELSRADSNFREVLETMKTPYEKRIYQNMVKQFLSEIAKLGYHP